MEVQVTDLLIVIGEQTANNFMLRRQVEELTQRIAVQQEYIERLENERMAVPAPPTAIRASNGRGDADVAVPG